MSSEVARGAEFSVSESLSRNPRVRIRDVPSSLAAVDLVECLASQNPSVFVETAAKVLRGNLKPIFRTGPRRTTLVDWMCEVTPVVLRALKKARSLYVEWCACHVTLRLYAVTIVVYLATR